MDLFVPSRHTLKPINFSWFELYCHRRAHGLSRSDPWRSQIKKCAVILSTGASNFTLSILHASRAISDQAYGVKEASVSILPPRKGWDFQLRLVALERAV